MAVDAAVANANANGIALQVIQSDLFEVHSGRKYDAIIFNMPFYRKGTVLPEEIATANSFGQCAVRFLDGAAEMLNPGRHVAFSLANLSRGTCSRAATGISSLPPATMTRWNRAGGYCSWEGLCSSTLPSNFASNAGLFQTMDFAFQNAPPLCSICR